MTGVETVLILNLIVIVSNLTVLVANSIFTTKELRKIASKRD
ncbi:hypothetical protein [Priestia aryabhattai]|nr:hypothetical protein [Priestia aryabhattai]